MVGARNEMDKNEMRKLKIGDKVKVKNTPLMRCFNGSCSHLECPVRNYKERIFVMESSGRLLYNRERSVCSFHEGLLDIINYKWIRMK